MKMQVELFENCEADNISYTQGSLASTPEITALFELSVDAFYSALYAKMSELPVRNELSRYVEKVLMAGSDEKAGGNRIAADRAGKDRGDPDVIAVLSAAGKVGKEINRLTGLLRFNPDKNGIYIARCSPDHFTLPALADHFTLRFGEIPWAIIDERRKLCLKHEKGGPTQLLSLSGACGLSKAERKTDESGDYWEGLWQLYHQSVNNEARNNKRLQKQFMPERYQRYLPEMRKPNE
jgi:probable DNA metabolism protein